ncbi:MAG: extracellular solute-binding protein, partial [Spirochaetaceae bacterium]|nr:extracellular solute-binding protein [Spirochaetaceae bacterium]
MRRSSVLVVLALVFAAGMAWGAGSTDDSTGGAVDVGGPLTPYQPAVDVSVWRIDSPSVEWVDGNTPDDNIWYDYYRKELGINLTNVWTVAATEAEQKISLSIASGDLPDIITANFTQLKQLSDNELLADMRPHYDSLATDLLRGLIEAPSMPPPVDYSNVNKPFDWAQYGWQGAPEALDAVTMNGQLAALPRQAIIDQNWQLWYVRRDWLENVGLPIPETFEELLTVARAFSSEDPDGNGENDTIGLGLEKNFLTSPVFHMLGFSSAFHAHPTIWIEDNAGDLVYGSIQPELKDALSVLRDLYSEGVLDREFPVKDWPKVGEGVAAGKIGLFCASMWNPLNPIQSNVSNDPEADWTSFMVVSADRNPA